MSALRVLVQREDIDVGAELARLEALGGGGIASFTGVVRGEGGMEMLELEHHPGMTEKVMRDIAEQAADRWSLVGVTVIHRYGPLRAGERIVLTAAAARHRHAALEACAYLIDWLKTEAPFWKKEHFADGRSAWVETRKSDAAATDRWRA
ncbi:molybdenum cofactor biosynthesis protein MoaE [Sphingomonas crocodyli]|uniref:Molybdopterin synthase catalytic subunit n=1 Tax=Sphingomonas crocodyli TaxID=1979270 RepID=A0A437M9G7_9SPHN|nr:molybdenum cofactor biosynthesis protein MoaE [Sphingomonas crocodyli]RVT94289.1 molybdenum cofactor biosynthesis protein MoaE [Sphingomonas crocodyli]